MTVVKLYFLIDKKIPSKLCPIKYNLKLLLVIK